MYSNYILKKKLDIQFVILLLLLESSFKERERKREREFNLISSLNLLINSIESKGN